MKALPLAVLFWLAALLLGTSNAQFNDDCIYYQDLAPSENYYIYNPQYPNGYVGLQSCLFTMQSDYMVDINCTLEMPWSLNCIEDKLIIGLSDTIQYSYCGSGTVALRSKGQRLTVEFKSPAWSRGGRFLCQVMATVAAKDENCTCGWKNPTRIVGGTETGVNEFPMMAALVDFNTKMPFCGGTIIDNNYLLTAAHCTLHRNITEYGVLIGDHDYTTGAETNSSKVYGIKRVIVHPNYSSSLKINDVAILGLKGTIQYTQKVGPACLPFEHSDDSFGGDHVQAIGWGSKEYGEGPSTTLQKVTLSVETNLECRKVYQDVTKNQICTYGNGKDACGMDSGGPILWENPTSHNMLLIGVINYGINCAVTSGVNLRVGAYVEWIVASTPDANYCVIE
ncbi:venom serine protease 34 [Megalopta genalis]|uniref:venom serine protease 34 n=1 Tax=Megalopta genalis TaxID=115081 RepID=UPI003FCFC2A8